jgi:hypothetical protein
MEHSSTIIEAPRIIQDTALAGKVELIDIYLAEPHK